MTDPIPMDDDGGALWRQLMLEREHREERQADGCAPIAVPTHVPIPTRERPFAAAR